MSDHQDEKAILPEQEQLVEGLLNTDQVFCVVCLHYMKEPAQMFMSSWDGIINVCEHIACRPCLSTLKKNNCPICSKPFNATIKSVLLEKLINRQKITCKHTGCEAIFKISEAKEHYQICPLEPDKCKHCKKQFIRKDIPAHEETCEYRIITCESCKGFYAFNKKDEHIKLYCPETVIKCPHEGCDAEAPRNLMRLHVDGCEHRSIRCPFSCDFMCKPKDMDAKHLSLNVCPNQLITCDKCDVMTNRCKLDEHLQTSCPMIKVSCDDCQFEDYRKNINKHFDVCPDYRIKCPKCNMLVRRKEMDKHNKEKQELHRILDSSVYKSLDIKMNGHIGYLDEGKEIKCTVQSISDGIVYLIGYKNILGSPKVAHFEVNLEKDFKKLVKHDVSKFLIEVGMHVDIEDKEGCWEPAIIKKIEGKNVYVHFINWDDKWDEVINMDSPRRFAKYGSHVSRSSLYMGAKSSDDHEKERNVVI
jgi:hypothetical protein